MGLFLVIFPINSISRISNITVLNGDNVLFDTEGEDTIDHYEIIYAGLNVVVYVCIY